MQQQQDQTAASRTPQYYDCRIYEPLEWNSIWLFFFSSLSLRFSLFFFFSLAAVLRSCCSSRTGSDRLYLWLRTAAHLLPLLLHSNDRDMKNSIIINPLREAEAGLMWWNFTRSREKKRTEGDRVGVKWNPIEISYVRIHVSDRQSSRKKTTETTYVCSTCATSFFSFYFSFTFFIAKLYALLETYSILRILRRNENQNLHIIWVTSQRHSEYVTFIVSILRCFQ